MSEDPFRIYFDPEEIGPDGYPWAWHKGAGGNPAIKDLVREQAGYRCIRCYHPYKGGGEWSPCDSRCIHGGPYRWWDPLEVRWFTADSGRVRGSGSEAQWRILTVHHLNGIKHDCRWFNLVSLCQRCHLTIQAKVRMERPWVKEHSEWFKPYVAAYYAWTILGEELSREETMARLEPLLTLQHSQDVIPGFPQIDRTIV